MAGYFSEMQSTWVFFNLHSDYRSKAVKRTLKHLMIERYPVEKNACRNWINYCRKCVNKWIINRQKITRVPTRIFVECLKLFETGNSKKIHEIVNMTARATVKYREEINKKKF